MNDVVGWNSRMTTGGEEKGRAEEGKRARGEGEYQSTRRHPAR